MDIAGLPCPSLTLIYATLPLLKESTKPADSAFKICMAVSPESNPGIVVSTPFRCNLRSRVAALEIDSQYVTLPEEGMITTSPGSEEDADADTSVPIGKGLEVCFEGCGNSKAKVSGETILTA